MNLSLLIHNIGSILSAIVSLGLALFTYFGHPRKVANTTLALTMLSVSVFYISHVIGVNLTDPLSSRAALMFNVSIIFIVMFNVHCVLSVIGKAREKRYLIAFFYASGIFLTLFYLLQPDAFLAPSTPKLYFPNYYEAGAYHWAMRVIFNFIIPVYFLLAMFRAYQQGDPVMRNRLKYFFLALTLGYSIGFIPVLLVFNIPVDPNWGLFFVFFYAVPFVYGVLFYQLLDIRILAKRAFLYALTVVAMSLSIIFISFSNNFIAARYPAFPLWLIPSLASLIAVGIGVFVWRKIRETDLLKYEFVTIITHKFRTPLTHIKWTTEELMKIKLPTEQRKQIEDIKISNNRLVELTNLLTTLSDSGKENYMYRRETVKLETFIRPIIMPYLKWFSEKGVRIVFQMTNNLPEVFLDSAKIRFVLRTILENALAYTATGGVVTVSVNTNGNEAIIRVKDTGIGISHEDQTRIFSKFFRSTAAKRVDTEGVGVGLFMAKIIMERHGGKIQVFSEGEGKGGSFTIILPLGRK